jgi:hypothetical protein
MFSDANRRILCSEAADRPAPRAAVAIKWILVIVTVLASPGARAGTMSIMCGGQTVGTLGWGSDGTTERAGFVALGTLAAVAAVCGENHYNWVQTVTSTTRPPVDSNGQRLQAPFLDRPHGGFGNDPTTGGDDTLWGDDADFYWDEGPDPPPNTPGFKSGYNIRDHTFPNALDFTDSPSLPPGNSAKFTTSLASVKADGSYTTLGSFDWTYSNANGTEPCSFVSYTSLTPLCSSDPGVSDVPEPSMLTLVTTGVLGFILVLGQWRVRGTTARPGRL